MPVVPVRATAEADGAAKALAETQKRVAEADAERRAADEKKRLADADAARVQQEQKRVAEADAERRAAEEKKRLADADAARVQQEQKRVAEADAERRAAEEKKRLAEAEAARVQQEQKRVAEADAERRAADETRRLAEAEAARRSVEQAKQVPGPEPAAPIVIASAQTPTLPPAAMTATLNAACDAAKLTAEALPAGQARIQVSSPCRKTQAVKLTYGPIVLERALGADGQFAFVLDVLFDTRQPLVASFADGRSETVVPSGLDIDNVTKVAVFWRGPVDLELHAFEYAAHEGEAGHVWSGAAQSSDETIKRIAADGRGHGFVTNVGASGSIGGRMQVYTFLHAPGGEPGVITMRLDYASRGAIATGDACGSGRLGSVDFDVLVRERGTAERLESNVIPAASCGEILARPVRLLAGAVPDIRVRN